MFFSKKYSRDDKVKIERFLNKYCQRFRDYDTAADAIYYHKLLTEYIDICFATADFLFNTIQKGRINPNKEIDQLAHYLKRETIIRVDYDSNSQCHSLILIPVDSKSYVVQSVGRMIDANWKLMDNAKIIASIRDLYNGVHEAFFGYQDDGNPPLSSISVSFKVAKRKKISEHLLPDLSPYEKKLRKLRSIFEREEAEAARSPSLSH